MTKPPTYFPQLTGIRAVAAYMVYLFHVTFPIGAVIQREFHIGVGVFFVLSGFLIYYRYFESFEHSRRWWVSYFKNRAARIYPMYLLLSIVTLLSLGAPLRDWLLSLTFAKGFFHDFYFTGISQGWSLTVEECFYFSAPLIFLLFRRHKFVLPLLMVYGVGLILTLSSQALGSPYGFFGSFRFTLVNTFLGRAFEFFVGMYLARLYLKRFQRAHASDGMASGQLTMLGLLITAGLVLWMASLQTPTELGLNHPVGIFINNILLPPAYALVFWGLLTERTIFRRFLSSKPMELLGKSSYVFYLIHVGPIQMWVSQMGVTLGLDFLSHYIFMFGALNLIAVGLFLWVEEPLNRRIRRTFGRP